MVAFVLASTLVGAAWLVCVKNVPGAPAVLWVLPAAIAGSIAELLSSDRIDDNLSIPLASAAALYLMNSIGLGP